jgi:NADH-quinone oxidoreductase subunit N
MIAVGSAGGYLVVGTLWVLGLMVALLEARIPQARRIAFFLGLAAATAATILAGLMWPGDSQLVLAGGGIRMDGFALYIQVFILLGVVCSLLMGLHAPENLEVGTTGLVLMAAAGASLLAMASDLMGILVAFVGALIPLWTIAVIYKGHNGREAALKGMVVGALAAALRGLGAALILTRTGTTQLAGIALYLQSADWIGSDPLMVVGLGLVLSGLGCFVAAVPFHMWFVDVVEGLPAPAALLLSGGVMAAGLAAAIRVLLVGFQPVVLSGFGYLSWTSILHALGLAALLICNALALVQRRLKRMVAYLAAGQAGLVLVTLAAIGDMGATGKQLVVSRAVGGVLVFLAVHAINWIGLFVAVEVIASGDGSDPKISRLSGLAHRHPWMAVAIGLAVLCMAGMPLTAGFFSRFYLLSAMVAADWTATAVVTALSLGLVLVMSLGLVATMVMRPEHPEDVRISPALKLVAVLSSVIILALGILPGGILDVAIQSAESLVGAP